MDQAASTYPCPCCGYLVFTEPPGSYDICSICFWEDDPVQLEFATTLTGGANKVTLLEAQANFVKLGASEPRLVRYVRKPSSTDVQEPGWRPIETQADKFEQWGSPTLRRSPSFGESLYYWRPTFWRRSA